MRDAAASANFVPVVLRMHVVIVGHVALNFSLVSSLSHSRILELSSLYSYAYLAAWKAMPYRMRRTPAQTFSSCTVKLAESASPFKIPCTGVVLRVYGENLLFQIKLIIL